jgi:hypothetical protein
LRSGQFDSASMLDLANLAMQFKKVMIPGLVSLVAGDLPFEQLVAMD